jgi:tripartite-type tricarboxylate transporter receptor subunit TctC
METVTLIRLLRQVFLLICLVLVGPVLAQSFPSKSVKMLVTNPPGGSSDIMARILAQKLSDLWKQNVVVENRAGAAGQIGMVHAASQAPDGYTLLFGAQGSTIVTPLLSKVPYNMAEDFTPLALAALGPSILMVNANSPYKTVQDLISAAKAKPNTINYGSGGIGTAAHLGAEMFNSYANIKTVHVPYKGGILAINDLAAEQIQFQFTDAAPVMSFIKSGKLRPLAVTTPNRFPAMPDVPTFVESGLPAFTAVNSWGVFMPSGAPPALVTQIQNDIRRALTNPDLVKRYSELGFEAQNISAEEFKSFLASENARYSKLIREVKIKVE